MIPLETFFWVKATNRGKPRQRAKVGGSPIWESPDGKSTPRGMFFLLRGRRYSKSTHRVQSTGDYFRKCSRGLVGRKLTEPFGGFGMQSRRRGEAIYLYCNLWSFRYCSLSILLFWFLGLLIVISSAACWSRVEKKVKKVFSRLYSLS